MAIEKCIPNPSKIFKIFLVLIYSSYAIAGETSGGGSSRRSSESANGQQKNRAQENTVTLKRDNCPAMLQDWIKDDYSDKYFGMFKSESQTCNTSVDTLRRNFANRGKPTNFNDSASLSQALGAKYSGRISSQYQSSLQDCQKLDSRQAQLVQARFYSAASKIESTNSLAVDEIAFIDSVMPEANSLNDMECTGVFPELKSKCDSYKKFGQQCSHQNKNRLDQLVAKTRKNLKEIDQLQKAYGECRAKSPKKEVCERIKAAVQILENETPWIRGEKFKQTLNADKLLGRNSAGLFGGNGGKKFQGRYNPENGLSDSDSSPQVLEAAIKEQFKENRAGLKKRYDQNLQDLRCMTFTTKDNGSACNFSEIRKNLNQMTNYEPKAMSRDAKENELNTFLEADQCLLERGEDRETTRETVAGAGRDAAFTILTMGSMGAVAGIRALSTASKLGRLKTGSQMLIAGGAGAYGAYGTLENVAKECSAGTAYVADRQPSKVAQQKQQETMIQSTMCEIGESQGVNFTEVSNSCMVDALLATTELVPFLGSIAALKLFGKKLTQEELAQMFKDPKRRAQVEEVLARNGKLADSERGPEAERLLGKKLSDEKKDCIVKAHQIGGHKGFGEYSQDELLGKKSLLSKCGFDLTDTTLLMRSGITGNSSSALASTGKYTDKLKEYDAAAEVHRKQFETGLRDDVVNSGYVNAQKVKTKLSPNDALQSATSFATYKRLMAEQLGKASPEAAKAEASQAQTLMKDALKRDPDYLHRSKTAELYLDVSAMSGDGDKMVAATKIVYSDIYKNNKDKYKSVEEAADAMAQMYSKELVTSSATRRNATVMKLAAIKKSYPYIKMPSEVERAIAPVMDKVK